MMWMTSSRETLARDVLVEPERGDVTMTSSSGHARWNVASVRRSMYGFCTAIARAGDDPALLEQSPRVKTTFSPVFVEPRLEEHLLARDAARRRDLGEHLGLAARPSRSSGHPCFPLNTSSGAQPSRNTSAAALRDARVVAAEDDDRVRRPQRVADAVVVPDDARPARRRSRPRS